MKRVYSPRPKKGVRAERPAEILHIDLTILRLIDGSRVFIQAVIDNASRYLLAHCVSTDYGGLRSRQLLLEALGKVRRAIVPNIYCDSGAENLNGAVDALVASEQMTRTVAQIDVAFSNSMIESFFRKLKHSWLFVHPLPNLGVVERLTDQYIRDHNELIPHSAHRGATPAEVFFGKWSPREQNRLDQRSARARADRLRANRDAQCQSCMLDIQLLPTG